MAIAAPAVQTSPIQEHVLANGLKVLIKEVHTAPLVSVWCWYRVGSKDEGPGTTGVSHWCEHMNFKGTANIPRDQVKGIIEQFGGFWNGYTFIDQTTYVETASRDALDRMLFIESERMASCLYHPDDCESERTVIISELQGGENDPDQLLDQELTATAFKAHTYKHPTIGWLADLKTMTREDLHGYYQTYYVPNNATLVIVGDVDAADALARADKYFGKIAARPLARQTATEEPEQLGERRLTISREATTAYLKIAYHVPAVTHADFFPLLVLDAVLTGAKGLNLWSSFRTPGPQRSARLYKALVDASLASSLQGALLPTQDPFLYTISLTATDGVALKTLEDAALREIERARAEGVIEQELTRAKRQLRARLVFENDSVTNIGHQIGYFETVASWQLYESLASRIQAVTLEEVAAVAARYLNDQSHHRLVRAYGGSVRHGLAPVRQELSNGMVVTAKESRAMPAVTIHASFEAGSVFDSPEQQGLAHFVSRVIDRGTETRSADDLAIAMEDRGASLAVSVNRHVLSLVCNCLAEDFEDTLAVVGDVAMHATFPSDQVAIRRAEIVTNIRQDEDNPAAMSGEGLLRELYAGHPYSLRPRGTVESVERMTDAALREFYRSRCVPAALSLVVVGDVDAGHAIDCTQRVFGAWDRPVPPAVPLPHVAPLTERRRVVLPMMNKAQADISYGFSTILRSDPAYYAFWLMNNILGQYSLGGRLGDSIRERQGMAYYVYSVLDANRVPGPFTVRAGVNPANVDRAVESIDQELTSMAAEGVTEKELGESKQYLIGSMPRTLETNGAIANFLQSAEYFKLGLDYDLRLPRLLERVTRDDVHEAARRVLDPSRAAVVIAGPYQ